MADRSTSPGRPTLQIEAILDDPAAEETPLLRIYGTAAIQGREYGFIDAAPDMIPAVAVKIGHTGFILVFDPAVWVTGRQPAPQEDSRRESSLLVFKTTEVYQ